MTDTWINRYQFNMNPGDPEDWLQLASAWRNRDGSITVIVNANLQSGERIWLRPKREGAPEKAPDFQYSVKRKYTKINEDGDLEVLASEERKQ